MLHLHLMFCSSCTYQVFVSILFVYTCIYWVSVKVLGCQSSSSFSCVRIFLDISLFSCLLSQRPFCERSHPGFIHDWHLVDSLSSPPPLPLVLNNDAWNADNLLPALSAIFQLKAFTLQNVPIRAPEMLGPAQLLRKWTAFCPPQQLLTIGKDSFCLPSVSS